MAEGAGAQPLQVGREGVVGAVDDPQVLAAPDLHPRLRQSSARRARQCGQRLDHHSLAPGPGQLRPPLGGGGHRGLVGGVDQHPPGAPEQRRFGVDQRVDPGEVLVVRADRQVGALGGEDLEGGELDPVQAVHRPAVAPVGLGERGGVSPAR